MVVMNFPRVSGPCTSISTLSSRNLLTSLFLVLAPVDLHLLSSKEGTSFASAGEPPATQQSVQRCQMQLSQKTVSQWQCSPCRALPHWGLSPACNWVRLSAPQRLSCVTSPPGSPICQPTDLTKSSGGHLEWGAPKDSSRQWCVGFMTGWLSRTEKKREPWLLALADFCGVNTVMTYFASPVCLHWARKWKETHSGNRWMACPPYAHNRCK